MGTRSRALGCSRQDGETDAGGRTNLLGDGGVWRLHAAMSSSSSGRGLSFSIGGLAPKMAGEITRTRERPLVVLVAADVSGRQARGQREPLAGRSARPVDVDRFDAELRGWNARIPVVVGGDSVWLEPRSFDELHPDHLLQNLPQLSTLLSLRRALGSDPNAAAQLAALLGPSEGGASNVGGASAPSSAAAPSAHGAPPGAPVGAAESSQDTLARLLGGARPSPERPAAAAPAAPSAARLRPDIDRFIRAIVDRAGAAPGVAPAEPGSPEVALGAAAEAEVGRRLRALLASPAFRTLEASWRGIDGLCRNNPDLERVSYLVLDATLDELAADPAGLGRLLGSTQPDLLLLDHRFAASAVELGGLARLLALCHERGVQLCAGAAPELAGCAHFDEVEQPEENEYVLPDDVRAAWAELRALRERGARLGLALPRFVLRQPYGAAGEPLEALRFEELLDPNDHEAFCWGNGAYLLVRALSDVHAEAARLRPDGGVEVRELPIVHLEKANEVTTKPPVESWLSERSVSRLRAAGFAVLQGVRHTDRVVIHAAG